MSLRRLGLNPDGTRRLIDDGPAHARRQGFGGSALGHFQGTTFTLGPTAAVRSAAQQRRLEMQRAAKARRRITKKSA